MSAQLTLCLIITLHLSYGAKLHARQDGNTVNTNGLCGRSTDVGGLSSKAPSVLLSVHSADGSMSYSTFKC